MILEKLVKKEPNSKVSVQVTVDKSSVKDARESVIKDFEKKVKLPGFRKGKVPRKLIINRFSRDIEEETINAILTQSIKQIIREDMLEPISKPLITKIGELIQDEHFAFSAEFDIIPDVKPGEYKGISSEKYHFEINDETVNTELEKLREHFATLISVDRAAELEDYIVVDYEEKGQDGKIRGKKNDETLFLNKKDEQLTKQLLGLKKGDAKVITLKGDYEKDGKRLPFTSDIHIHVKDVKTRELPELDDEFARDISDTKTLDELKKKVREGLEEDALRLSEEKTKDELVKKVIEGSEFAIPETMIEHEIDRILEGIASSHRINFEDLKRDGKKYEEYRKSVRPRATNRLKYELVLDRIAQNEEIKVTDEEVDGEIKRYAKETKRSFQDLKSSMMKDGRIDNYRYRIKLSKALEYIYKNAKLDKIKKLKYEYEKEGGIE